MYRAMLYGSYKKPRELLWIIGMFIYLILMGEAFFGYLLPWIDRSPVKSIRYRGWKYKTALAAFTVSFVALGYLGMQEATPVFTLMARIFSVIYFLFFLLMPIYTSMDKDKPVPERVTYL